MKACFMPRDELQGKGIEIRQRQQKIKGLELE